MKPRNSQRGVALLEALVAGLVLAIGLVGLGLLLARQLVELRRDATHASAVQHIDSLSDSMHINRDAALQGRYAMAWKHWRSASVDCRVAACDAAQLADHDLDLWGRSLRGAVPSAQAIVLGSAGSPQLVIGVAWPASEREMGPTDVALQAALTDVTAALHGIDCPPAHLCHVGHVQP